MPKLGHTALEGKVSSGKNSRTPKGKGWRWQKNSPFLPLQALKMSLPERDYAGIKIEDTTRQMIKSISSFREVTCLSLYTCNSFPGKHIKRFIYEPNSWSSAWLIYLCSWLWQEGLPSPTRRASRQFYSHWGYITNHLLLHCWLWLLFLP